MEEPRRDEERRSWLFAVTVLLGVFLTVRGYRSLEGDQAYRLPLLIHAHQPQLLADDPFVTTFDRFNPHRGSLALIRVASTPLGLSAGLLGLFVGTFYLTAWGIGRLARSCWPEAGPGVGLVAFGLVLCALAGNIGTNHLFEPILLDRLMAFALGWAALVVCVGQAPRAWLSSVLLGATCLVHPTIALQLTMLVGGCLVLTAAAQRQHGRAWLDVVARMGVIALALIPGLLLNMRGSGSILDGLPVDVFRRLSVEIQGPQHMLPHLWRFPQWLAWGCYPWLALLTAGAVASRESTLPDGTSGRAAIFRLLLVTLVFLAVSWVGIEVFGVLRLTLFQPFRMATIARGLCLVVVAGHVLELWGRGGPVPRLRASLLVLGLSGDWMFVAVTGAETLWVVGPRLVEWWTGRAAGWQAAIPGWLALGWGWWHLSRHDTESGHVPMTLVLVAGWIGYSWLQRHPLTWTPGRRRRVAALAWAIPMMALVVAVLPETWASRREGVGAWLVRRCRFGEDPLDDFERLALWCRRHTPADARFIGPPGPKGFRLWAHRSLAFNRAGSPYTARGLGDWAERFRAHVGFDGSLDTFARVYQTDRHRLERGYDRLDAASLADLARSQGADFILARSVDLDRRSLKPLHREGTWTVYRRVEAPAVASTHR